MTDTVNKMVAEGLFKGQKGDKGDPGQTGELVLATTTPDDAMVVPAAIDYNSNIPGNMAGFTELSANDFTAGTSLTVNSGPVDFHLRCQFESWTVLGKLTRKLHGQHDYERFKVNTIESPSGAFLSHGGVWVMPPVRGLKETLPRSARKYFNQNRRPADLYLELQKRKPRRSAYGPDGRRFLRDLWFG